MRKLKSWWKTFQYLRTWIYCAKKVRAQIDEIPLENRPAREEALKVLYGFHRSIGYCLMILLFIYPSISDDDWDIEWPN